MSLNKENKGTNLCDKIQVFVCLQFLSFSFYGLVDEQKHFPLIIIIIIIIIIWAIGLMIRVFANDPGDRDSIPGRVVPKTQKMVLVAALLNTQHYMVQLKS